MVIPAIIFQLQNSVYNYEQIINTLFYIITFWRKNYGQDHTCIYSFLFLPLHNSQLCSFLFITPSFAQSDKEEILNTVQKLFDGFATKDTLALRQVLLPNGQFYSVREDSNQVITKRTLHSDVIKRISMDQKQIR
jgi:hypothetical protein